MLPLHKRDHKQGHGNNVKLTPYKIIKVGHWSVILEQRGENVMLVFFSALLSWHKQLRHHSSISTEESEQQQQQQQCGALCCKLATWFQPAAVHLQRHAVNYAEAMSKQLECKSNTSGVTLVSWDPVIYPHRFCCWFLLSEILIWAQHFVNIYPIGRQDVRPEQAKQKE